VQQIEMKKNKKNIKAINRQLLVLGIGIILSLFALPALLSGNLSELVKVHSGRLRSIPVILFLILGLTLIILSLINIFKIKIKNKKHEYSKHS
jgi:hypothetical protein